VPNGTIVITLVESVSLTMYKMYPTSFVDGSGRVNVVAFVPTIATISSTGEILYVVSVGSMTTRGNTGEIATFPTPSVTRSPGVEEEDGQVNGPILIFDPLGFITVVVTFEHEILPGTDISYACMQIIK